MVLLFFPFSNEHVDLLDRNKFLDLFDEHKEQILRKRKEYESGLDFASIIEELANIKDDLETGKTENADLRNGSFLDSVIAMTPNMDDLTHITPQQTSMIGQRRNVKNTVGSSEYRI